MLSAQEKKQAMVNDLAGRLYATIEDIYISKGISFNPMFRQYAYRLDAGLDNNLLNLETTLLGLSVICKPNQKSFLGKAADLVFSSSDQDKIMPKPFTEYIKQLKSLSYHL